MSISAIQTPKLNNHLNGFKAALSKSFSHWSVDRYGRLISGFLISIFLLMSMYNPYWNLGALVVSLSLVLTSISDKCIVHDFLIQLGAKDREDIFLSGGKLKQVLKSEKIEVRDEIEKKHQIKEKKRSATSQALWVLKEEVEIGSPKWEISEKINFRISVASNRVDREKVYQLSQKVYGQCGYSSQDRNKLFVNSDDARPDTITFLAEDENGNSVASISVVSNVHGDIPCQKIFKDELSELNNQNKKMVEITRLVVDESYRNSRNLIKNLMNFVYIHAYKNLASDHMLIEVNPRHVGYYKRLLCFEVIGDSKPCGRVQGAPAVLLKLDLGKAEEKIIAGRNTTARVGRKTLYNYFVLEMQEAYIGDFIRESSRPMSVDEMCYFGVEHELVLA
ncbi:MAG: hypothetical protein JKY67_23155 [Pseudomonadales bacterium]|nr:hypothetical protein [Pseudomonadales bacterium]PCJ62265.1 MAG: hypothetical protein COA79_04170 [Planctomycetota bacterium]